MSHQITNTSKNCEAPCARRKWKPFYQNAWNRTSKRSDQILTKPRRLQETILEKRLSDWSPHEMWWTNTDWTMISLRVLRDVWELMVIMTHFGLPLKFSELPRKLLSSGFTYTFSGHCRSISMQTTKKFRGTLILYCMAKYFADRQPFVFSWYDYNLSVSIQ